MIPVILGTGCILLAAYDIFAILFNPRQKPSPSQRIIRFLWHKLGGRLSDHPPLLGFAGPLLVLLIIGYWVFSMVLGWALVYLPFLPRESFQIASNLVPSSQASFIDALYFSLVTLTTLGFGDITPTGNVFRVLVPIEAAIGFTLLSAGISWILSVYPALARRRELAHLIVITWNQAGAGGLSGLGLEDGEVATFYRELTSKLLIVRSDLLQFPITFYFYSSEELSNLPRAVGYLPQLLDADASGTSAAGARLHIRSASDALDSLANTIAGNFLTDLDPAAPTTEILHIYATEWAPSQ